MSWQATARTTPAASSIAFQLWGVNANVAWALLCFFIAPSLGVSSTGGARTKCPESSR